MDIELELNRLFNLQIDYEMTAINPIPNFVRLAEAGYGDEPSHLGVRLEAGYGDEVLPRHFITEA